MRTIIVLALALVGCTKPNPDRCCTDEADCATAQLPLGTACDDGLVCRGNFCVVEVCDTNAACDLQFPYCVGTPDGSCQETCTEDAQCPGNGESPNEHFCTEGSCVQCRTANDCARESPVCSAGTCVACTEHEQCASGACKADGECATADEVTYVDVLGSATSDCGALTPCSTIERALTFQATRPYVVIAPGFYSRTGPLRLTNPHWFIGRGTPRPIIDRLDDGPIFYLQGIANVHASNLEVTGATGTGFDLAGGYAFYCVAMSNVPMLDLRRSYVHDVPHGISARGCSVSGSKNMFVNAWVELVDTDASLDGNTFQTSNVNLDGGLFTFRNNIVDRAQLQIYLPSTGNTIEFNTTVNASVLCEAVTPQALSNNIFAGSPNPTTPTCSFPGSIVAPTDISALKFKHADSPPYDYHLLPGSSAIDAAMGTSSLDHDIDGETRPKGMARDVGADEAQ